MKNNKKILSIIIALLSLNVSGCKKYATGYNDHYVSPFFSSDNDFIMPLETTVLLRTYFEEQYEEIVDNFDDIIVSLHKLADRNHYYDDVINLKNVNDTYGTGQEIVVDKELFDMIKLGVELTQISKGAFNIAMGSLIDAWDGKFDTPGQYGTDIDNSKIVSALSAIPNFEQIDSIIVLNENNNSIKFNNLAGASENVKISLGALSKGYIMGKAYDYISSLNYPAIINAGSSTLATIGDNPLKGRDGWTVGLNNPLLVNDLTDQFLCNLQYSGSLKFSTSADTQQNFLLNDGDKTIIRHHILDTNTGYSNNYHRSITLVSKDASLALLDGLSTALYNIKTYDAINKLLDSVHDMYGVSISYLITDTYNDSFEQFKVCYSQSFKDIVDNDSFSPKVKEIEIAYNK